MKAKYFAAKIRQTDYKLENDVLFEMLDKLEGRVDMTD
jgi:hypothetical protein